MKDSNKNNPFKTPEGYFEGFEARLRNTLSEEMSRIPEESGFAVPDDYFDSLHGKVLEKLNAKEIKVIPLHSYKKYYYAAASIAAVILMVFGLNWNTSVAPTFESLAETDIENYFETNDYDLSAYEIAEVIPLDELEINDILSNGFDAENIIDYLDENTNEFEELNLEEYE